MIKLYKIKIGEKVYEVELEAVSEKEGKIETAKPENIKEEKAEKPENKVTGQATGSVKVEAPMQGLVISVDVSSESPLSGGKKVRPEDIKDEKMLAAVAVAVIDAAGEIDNAYIKVRSIREIS